MRLWIIFVFLHALVILLSQGNDAGHSSVASGHEDHNPVPAQAGDHSSSSHGSNHALEGDHGSSSAEEGAHGSSSAEEGTHGSSSAQAGDHGSSSAHGSAHGSSHGDHGHHKPDLSPIVLFTGGLLLVATLYYMMSKAFCVGGVIYTTWKWVSMTMSLFCAVLFWQGWNNIILQRKSVLQERGVAVPMIQMELVAMAMLFTAFFLLVFIWVMMCGTRCTHWATKHIGAFLKVWAHVVGFALLNVVAHLQDFAVAVADATGGGRQQLFWIAGAVWLVCLVLVPGLLRGIHIVLFHHFGAYFFDDFDEEHPDEHKRPEKLREKLHEELREFTADACALALSWSFMRVIIAATLGEMPNIFQTTHRTKSFHEKRTLFLLALIFTVSAGAWALFGKILKNKWRSYQYTHRGQYHHMGVMNNIFLMTRVFTTNFFSMLAAFTWLQWIRWNSYEFDIEFIGGNAHMNLTYHIVIAYGITFLSLASVPCIAALESSSYASLFADFVILLALLSAFSWEIAMDIMFELLAKDEESATGPFDEIVKATFAGTPLWSLAIFSLLLLVLVPLYINGIYPMTAERSIKQALKHAASIDLDANTSSDSDSESTIEEE